MKTFFSLILISLPVFGFSQIDVSGTIDDKVNEKTGDAIDAVWNAPGKIIEKKKEKKEEEAKADSTKASTTAKSTSAAGSDSGNAPAIAAYQNYDFVPGNDLVFKDNFASDEDGEFPDHWKLSAGQGVVNKLQNTPSFFLTQGNYVKVQPKISNANYLSNAFSIETDLYSANGDFGLVVFFYVGNDQQMSIALNQNSVVCEFPGSGNLNADYPASVGGTNFQNKWHHIAITYKENA
ncbi:MAG TPA: hypothetical protein VFJ43_00925, partial [Bacteroidia bacterium]|nr:hypothetical protein [Bacteroidia bacterium]